MSALFTAGFLDSHSEEVRLPDVPASAAKAVLEWLYAGECLLADEHELLPVLRAASRLQVKPLLDSCADAVRMRLTLDNVVDGIDLANELALTSLKDAAIELLANSFHEYIEDEQGSLLLSLSPATLESVLAVPTLAVPSEEAACDAVLRWARYHRPEITQMRLLLTKLRLRYASWEYLSSLRHEPLFDAGVLADACVLKAGYAQALTEPPRHDGPMTLALLQDPTLCRVEPLDAAGSASSSRIASASPVHERPHRPMARHPELNATMREILIDWLWEVAAEHSIGHQEVAAAAQFIDRFLAATTSCKRAEFQLLGISCLRLRLASAGGNSLTPQQAVFLTDDSYSLDELFAMEKRIATALEFDFRAPTARSALALLAELEDDEYLSDRPSEEKGKKGAGFYSDTVAALCEYLCDLAVQKEQMLRWQPLEVASSALLLARYVSDKPRPVRMRANGLKWLMPREECIAELRRAFEENKRSGRGVPEILRKHARFSQVSKWEPLSARNAVSPREIITSMAPQVA